MDENEKKEKEMIKKIIDAIERAGISGTKIKLDVAEACDLGADAIELIEEKKYADAYKKLDGASCLGEDYCDILFWTAPRDLLKQFIDNIENKEG